MTYWRTLTTRDFLIFKKITFDAYLVEYPINKLCLINEQKPGNFDRELAMVSLAIQEIYTCNRAIFIARFSPPRRDLFIVRFNQPAVLSATLHTVPPRWLDVITQKYKLLDELPNWDKNHF